MTRAATGSDQRQPVAGLNGKPRNCRPRSMAGTLIHDGSRHGARLASGQWTAMPLRRSPARASAAAAAAAILNFVKTNRISVLNVAGPRASGWPEGFSVAFEVIATT
jgi:hypothetical protein